MNQPNFDQNNLVSSILKVTASEDVNISEDLSISDENQKTIAELLNEKKETDKENQIKE